MLDEADTTQEVAREKLIGLAEAAKLSGLTHDHLRRIARDRKLWAVKIGRDWLTTEEAVKAYLVKDRRPGPKSTD
ncbi:MAG: helix-turn-helix domain-containing protein [Deltaproteobacteria bacterium]|nr:helix-turn-helix domain-containing protein [Deltaproteobacteria bacterium]